MNRIGINKIISDLLIYFYSITLIIFTIMSHNSLMQINTSASGSFMNKVATFMLMLFIFINIAIWIVTIFYSKKFTIIDIFTIFIILLTFGLVLGIHIITEEELACFIMLPNCRYINFKKFMYYDFWSKLFILCMVVFLSIINILPNKVSSGISSNAASGLSELNRSSSRYGFGFNNPNILAGFAFSVLIAYIIIFFFNKMERSIINRILIIISMFIIYVILNKITNSESVNISLLVLILLLFIFFVGVHKIIRICVLPIFVISLLLAIILPVLFNKNTPFFINLDNLLDGRLNMQNYMISLHPINLLGHSDINNYEVSLGGSIDNLPIYILLFSGILGFLLYYAIILNLSIHAIKCKYIIFPIIFIVLFIYSLVEKQSSYLYYYSFMIEPLIIGYQLKYRSKVRK